LLKKLP
ncbi:histone H1-like nucleoHC2 family protein, partial [Chlamydia suis MD56]